MTDVSKPVISTPNSMRLTFSIKGCKCTSFEFTEFSKNNTSTTDFDKYTFNINIAFTIIENQKLVSFNIDVTMTDKQVAGNQIAVLKSVHEFSIVNLDEVLIKTQQGIALADQIITSLVAISVSNVRGMFSVKLENSIYSAVVLPVIDASQLIPKKTSTLG